MTVLKDLRLRLKLTQEEMAKELNVSVWSIVKWEAGRHHPNFDFLQLKKLYVLLARQNLSIMDLPDDNFGELPIRK